MIYFIQIYDSGVSLSKLLKRNRFLVCIHPAERSHRESSHRFAVTGADVAHNRNGEFSEPVLKKFINLVTSIVAVIRAVGEISEENSGYILEKTSHPHLRQIHVERRDGLLNVLKEEDFSGGLKLLEGSTGSAEK